MSYLNGMQISKLFLDCFQLINIKRDCKIVCQFFRKLIRTICFYTECGFNIYYVEIYLEFSNFLYTFEMKWTPVVLGNQGLISTSDLNAHVSPA